MGRVLCTRPILSVILHELCKSEMGPKFWKLRKPFHPKTKLSIRRVFPTKTAIESRVLPVICSSSSSVS